MLFLDCLAEASARSGPGLQWSLEASRPCGRLVLKQAISEGSPEAPCERITEVQASDLDVRKVYITGILSDGLRYIRAVCGLYREAVRTVEKKGAEATERDSFSAIFRFPIAPGGAEGMAILESFRAYLAECGATPPVLSTAGMEELLSPLKDSLSGAGGPGEEEKTELAPDTLLLRREKKPARGPAERWTFELLSLDERAVTCHRSATAADEWQVTLNSLEHLPTTVWQYARGGSTTSWSFVLPFPGQPEAERFARVVTETVPVLRERLYEQWQRQRGA